MDHSGNGTASLGKLTDEEKRELATAHNVDPFEGVSSEDEGNPSDYEDITDGSGTSSDYSTSEDEAEDSDYEGPAAQRGSPGDAAPYDQRPLVIDGSSDSSDDDEPPLKRRRHNAPRARAAAAPKIDQSEVLAEIAKLNARVDVLVTALNVIIERSSL